MTTPDARAAVQPPIAIQFCSDMHLEMPMAKNNFGQHLADVYRKHNPDEDEAATQVLSATNVLPRCAPYLALLGDIFNGKRIEDGTYAAYLRLQAPGYQAIFLLLGNHEFYLKEHGAVRRKMRAMCAELTTEFNGQPTVHLLDQDAIDLPNSQLRLLGCTLWSHVGATAAVAVGGGLSDYRAIQVADAEGSRHTATVEDTNRWHASELGWLQTQLAAATADGKHAVVLSHHAPSQHGTGAPQHANSPIAAGFGTPLEAMLQPPVVAWLFGHTHWSSWQSFSHGKWTSLSGGLDGQLTESELHAAPECVGGRDVLLASNQLGYASKGEHTCGAGSRCHPGLTLELAPSGAWARLRCSPLTARVSR